MGQGLGVGVVTECRGGAGGQGLGRRDGREREGGRQRSFRLSHSTAPHVSDPARIGVGVGGEGGYLKKSVLISVSLKFIYPQTRKFDYITRNNKQQFDGFVGELTLQERILK